MELAQLSLEERVERCRTFSEPYRLTASKKFRLKTIDPDDTGALTSEDKQQAKEALAVGVEVLAELQERLYAQDRWALGSLDLSFPQVSEGNKQELAAARLALEGNHRAPLIRWPRAIRRPGA